MSLHTILNEYEDDLRFRKRRSPEHLRKTMQYLRAAADEIPWAEPRDISVHSAEKYLAARFSGGNTHDKVASMLRVFGVWLKRRGFLKTNVLDDIECRGGPRGAGQRALTAGELRAMFKAARAMEVSDKRPRAARSVIYLAAALTGLRYGELKHLRWDHVFLEGSPRLELSAEPGAQKVRRAGIVLPLAPELAEALAQWKPASIAQASAKGTNPARAGFVFPLMPSHHSVDEDMARAGVAKVDARGKAASFHSTRKFLATQLRRGGVDVAIRKKMMRHESEHLTTGTYDDCEVGELAAAMATVPRLSTADGAGGTKKARKNSRTLDKAPMDGTIKPSPELPPTTRSAGSHQPAETPSKWSRGELNPRPRTQDLVDLLTGMLECVKRLAGAEESAHGQPKHVPRMRASSHQVRDRSFPPLRLAD
jgi:integrase